MKPLRLHMRAFGPYADDQSLDFQELGSSQLLLIHGPTGAGKSAILDAVCYALYGDTSGSDRTARQMRSDHADPGTPTEVTLDFSLGPRAFRITRSPEQERPKLRGEGSTLQAARATLWELTAGAATSERLLLADRATAVTDAVHDLLGFTAAEFRQVVVLPQGKFQHLLTASSDEREHILETLFRTEHYRRIQETLGEERRRLEADVERTRSSRDVLLTQVGVGSSQALEVLHSGRIREQKALGEALLGLEATRRTAEAAYQTASLHSRLLHDAAEAEGALAKLAGSTDNNEAVRASLVRARKALPILEVKRDRDKAQSALDAGVAAVTEQTARLEAARSEHHSALARMHAEDARKAAREEAVATIARLQSLLRWSREREETLGLLDAVEGRLAVTRDAFALRSSTLEQLTVQEGDLNAQCQSSHAIASQLEARTLATRQLKAIKEASDALADAESGSASLLKDKQVADRTLAACEKSIAKARESLERREHAWRAGQAGALARTLVEGAPCPVCGSTRHPSPASKKRAVPREEDLENEREAILTAETERNEARARVEELALRLAALESEAATLRKQMGTHAGHSPPSLVTALKHAEAALGESRAEAQRSAQLEQRASALKSEMETARHDKESLALERESLTNQLTALRTTLSHAEKELPEDLRDARSLSRALSSARARLEELESAADEARKGLDVANHAFTSATSRLESLVTQVQQAQADVRESQARLEERLAGGGFGNERELAAAALSEVLIDAYDAQVRRFDEQLAAARERAERARHGAEGLASPDLTALEQRRQETASAHLDAIRNEERLRGLVAQTTEVLGQVRAIEERLPSIEHRFSILGRLSELADGRNPLGLPFHRFVLASLLDDVLREASQRLRIMSGTRYTLVRGQTQRDRRSTTGLDLDVFDAYTGGLRPVVTLSGGETFLASLSLALGLADVVQAYAGGIRLDAVFVDEGFGSLDPESLELALRALVDLQRGGRLVGLISHVPELKERIPARLEVTSGRRGSQARFVITT